MKRRALRPILIAAFAACSGFSGNSWAQPQPQPQPPAPPPPPAVAPAPPVPAAPPVQAAPPAAPDSSRTPLSLADAIRTTLRYHPAIRVARTELKTRNAQLEVAEGPFDPAFLASASHQHNETPLLPNQRLIPAQSATINDTTDLNLGASAATKWGMNVAPNVGVQRIHVRTRGGVPPGFPPEDPFHQASVGVTVVQRLLRGAGWVGAASAIDSARDGRKAAIHNIAHESQRRVLNTALAYFELVAAGEQLALLRAAAAAAKKRFDDTQVLVASEQRPRSDLRQLEGYLADRNRAVLEAQNAEAQALYRLRSAMGLSAGSGPEWRATDSFPPARNPDYNAGSLVKTARKQRRDLKAAQSLVAAAAASLRGADKNTQPALDLSANFGYSSAIDSDGVDAFFLAPGSNIPGVNAGVGLSLELPFNNTAQRAERDLRRADLDQATIAAGDMLRTLPIDVLSTLDDLRLSTAALEAASLAVRQYALAVGDERDKLREGAGTVIDLLTTEDNLIAAQQAETDNRFRYAAALCRLRFEIGAMPNEIAAVETSVRDLVSSGVQRAAGQ